jgi:hypothetical protein
MGRHYLDMDPPEDLTEALYIRLRASGLAALNQFTPEPLGAQQTILLFRARILSA